MVVSWFSRWFHGFSWFLVGFHGFSRWFHGFSWFLVGFHGFSSWFHGFSWFLVGLHGFSSWFHGFSWFFFFFFFFYGHICFYLAQSIFFIKTLHNVSSLQVFVVSFYMKIQELVSYCIFYTD